MRDDSIDVSSSTIETKTTAIKNLVFFFELRLRGHKWTGNGDYFVDTGTDLVGEEVITKLIGLLQPFCEESNLITSKSFETFSKQKWEIDSTMNESLLNNLGCPADNQKVVIKMFKTTLQNIGDIILSSKSFMRDMLRVPTDERKVDLNV